MAVVSIANGAQTAVISTEHTVDTQTAMDNGDVVILRIKTKCKSGSTSRLAYEAAFSHVQADKNKYSIPVPVSDEIICTLQQTAGTGRDFDWNLLVI